MVKDTPCHSKYMHTRHPILKSQAHTIITVNER